MFPGKIEVLLDEKVIQQEIKKQLDHSLLKQLWFVDVKKICELSCLSTRYLEEVVFSDYRMKAIQMQKGRKRIWPANEAFEVMKEILSEE